MTYEAARKMSKRAIPDVLRGEDWRFSPYQHTFYFQSVSSPFINYRSPDSSNQTKLVIHNAKKMTNNVEMPNDERQDYHMA